MFRLLIDKVTAVPATHIPLFTQFETLHEMRNVSMFQLADVIQPYCRRVPQKAPHYGQCRMTWYRGLELSANKINRTWFIHYSASEFHTPLSPKSRLLQVHSTLDSFRNRCQTRFSYIRKMSNKKWFHTVPFKYQVAWQQGIPVYTTVYAATQPTLYQPYTNPRSPSFKLLTLHPPNLGYYY